MASPSSHLVVSVTPSHSATPAAARIHRRVGAPAGVSTSTDLINELTGGFQWAFWVGGLTALAAVPVTFLLIRRRELARAVATATQRDAPVSVPADR